MGLTIRKFFQLKGFRIRIREASTVRVYPGWTGYQWAVAVEELDTL